MERKLGEGGAGRAAWCPDPQVLMVGIWSDWLGLFFSDWACLGPRHGLRVAQPMAFLLLFPGGSSSQGPARPLPPPSGRLLCPPRPHPRPCFPDPNQQPSDAFFDLWNFLEALLGCQL
jgi:hypothetical protein